jgi:hypothetical protein
MKAPISEELAAFLESGLAIVVGCRDAQLRPDGAWASAVRVHEDRVHLTLFMTEEGASCMLRHLRAFPQIAIVFDLPTSHRACQVKGELVRSRPAREEERPLVERQLDAFTADLAAIGIPREMSMAWRSWPCTALEVRATTIFEQTPGPGTGEPLR